MSKNNNSLHWLGKRFLLLVLSLTLVLGVAACRREDPENGDPNDNDDPIVVDDTITTTKVELFDGPNMLDSSDKVDIFVEGEEVFVYETRVNHNRVFSYSYPNTKAPVAIFDFEGRIEVTLVIPDVEEIESAVVRPLSFEVEPQIDGNTISFTLDYPTSYVVEYNDDPKTAIHLFTNRPETEEERVDPDNIPDDMIYIGPGVHKADAIPIESGQTLYIAGGALVYGQVRAESVEDVTIRGRGIIDGAIYHRRRAAEFTIPIEFRHSSNIRIEGITFLDSAGWTINAYFLDGFEMRNVNIITARANGDGISIQSSKNVDIRDSFVRSWDDSLVVKNYNRGTSENIHFENIVIWTDLAQSMEIGYETYGEYMRDISFKDITVLHNFHKPVISIHNADDAVIENVRFENITVENAEIIGDSHGSSHDNFFIDFTIQYNLEWTSSGGQRGHTRDVTVDNVLVLDGRDDVVSRIAGDSAEHRVENVEINNVTYKDIAVEAADDLNFTISHASNVTFSHDPEQVTGARVHFPYELKLEDDEVAITIHENIDQQGYLIPDFAAGEVPTLYMGNQVTGDFTAQSSRGTGLLNWDVDDAPFNTGDHVSARAIDGDLSTMWVAGDFETTVRTEFAALSVFFGEDKALGTIRVHGNPDSDIYQLQNIAVFGVRAGAATDTFVKLTNSEDYEFSPATGNYADININPGEYRAIQLRFYNESGVAYPENPFTSGIEFYPASLSFQKSVTATPHEDVYDAHNITDGNRMTYYESERGTWPAEVTIDLAGTYDITYISLHLPPLMLWEPREQEIEVQISTDGTNFETIVEPTYYDFNPMEGNVAEITLDEAVNTQYVRFVFTANTAPGNVHAQISQINIFE